MHYTPKGICAVDINFEVEDNIVKSVVFTGGCDGNHKGLNSLMKGMDIKEVADRLEGITCGFRSTSCPDQLAKVLRTMIAED